MIISLFLLEGNGAVRLNDSSVVALINQCKRTAVDQRPLQAKSDIETESTKIFLKQDRDQTEVFITSNYNGYLTVCRRSLSNPNFIELIQIISVFCHFVHFLSHGFQICIFRRTYQKLSACKVSML